MSLFQYTCVNMLFGVWGLIGIPILGLIISYRIGREDGKKFAKGSRGERK